MRWSLTPSWAKGNNISYSTFNARADSVATKSAFRGAWKAKRRCLIISGGFCGWRKVDKQPFCIVLGNRQPMLFAGLWETTYPKKGERVTSCGIITTDANSLIVPLHDHMPVILGAENVGARLDEEAIADRASLLKPFAPERLDIWPVDRRVGNVSSQGLQQTEPIAV